MSAIKPEQYSFHTFCQLFRFICVCTVSTTLHTIFPFSLYVSRISTVLHFYQNFGLRSGFLIYSMNDVPISNNQHYHMKGKIGNGRVKSQICFAERLRSEERRVGKECRS